MPISTNDKPDNRRDLDEEERLKEAGKILRRVDCDSEALSTSSMTRVANRVKSHLEASDADQEDKMEIWGTRIARWTAIIFAFFLLLWLINHLSH